MAEWELKRLQRESRLRVDARDRRTNLALALALLMVLTSALVAMASANLASPTVPESSRMVAVHPGQALWDIATSNPIPGVTTPELVSMIMAINGLEDATIHPGTILEIPCFDDTRLASM